MWYRVKYSQPTTSPPPAAATRLTHKTVPAYPLLPSFSANCLKQKGSTTKLFCDAMLMFLLNWWFLELLETNADRDRRCDAFVDWRLMSSGRYFLMLVSAQWRNWERRRRREKREKGGGEELFVFPPSPLLSSLLARQPSSTHIGARVRHNWQQRDRKTAERSPHFISNAIGECCYCRSWWLRLLDQLCGQKWQGWSDVHEAWGAASHEQIALCHFSLTVVASDISCWCLDRDIWSRECI